MDWMDVWMWLDGRLTFYWHRKAGLVQLTFAPLALRPSMSYTTIWPGYTMRILWGFFMQLTVFDERR